jgi:hypothetical protein
MTSILRRTVVVGLTVLTLVAVTGGVASASVRSAPRHLQTHV